MNNDTLEKVGKSYHDCNFATEAIFTFIKFNFYVKKESQTEIKLELKYLGWQTKTSEVGLSLPNRLQDMKEIILDVKDKVEEMDSMVKEK